MSPADDAAHAASSYVRPTPKLIAAKAVDRSGLSARGLAALARIEAELEAAWAWRGAA
jgi:hypothetical protein